MPDDAQFKAGRITARFYKLEAGVVYVWRSMLGKWHPSTMTIDQLQKSWNYEPIGRETAFDF